MQNQLDQLKLEYSGRSGWYMLQDTEKMKHLGNKISRAQRGLLPGAVETTSKAINKEDCISNNKNYPLLVIVGLATIYLLIIALFVLPVHFNSQ